MQKVDKPSTNLDLLFQTFELPPFPPLSMMPVVELDLATKLPEQRGNDSRNMTEMEPGEETTTNQRSSK